MYRTGMIVTDDNRKLFSRADLEESETFTSGSVAFEAEVAEARARLKRNLYGKH
jgi:hypothetical protein